MIITDIIKSAPRSSTHYNSNLKCPYIKYTTSGIYYFMYDEWVEYSDIKRGNKHTHESIKLENLEMQWQQFSTSGLYYEN